MIAGLILFFAVAALAYANGSNDNFKGVATLFGSGVTNYRRALLWATAATALGSVAAAFFAGRLLESFSGRGLVPLALVADPRYVAAVAAGAGLTVLLASRLGLPVSTTHGLVGALLGAGWAAGASINATKLGYDFLLPLLISPLLAVAVTAVGHAIVRPVNRRTSEATDACLCLEQPLLAAGAQPVGTAVLRTAATTALKVGSVRECRQGWMRVLMSWNMSELLDRLHYLSAGAVSFARGLNDTPKIAALLLVAPAVGGVPGTLLVAVAIAAGGLISARRVAMVMSRRITPLAPGQGLLANLATSAIVIGASRFGLPVSTTHVACGSLFGIGLVTGRGRPQTVRTILAAWLGTLPLAAAIGMAAFALLSNL